MGLEDILIGALMLAKPAFRDVQAAVADHSLKKDETELEEHGLSKEWFDNCVYMNDQEQAEYFDAIGLTETQKEIANRYVMSKARSVVRHSELEDEVRELKDKMNNSD